MLGWMLESMKTLTRIHPAFYTIAAPDREILEICGGLDTVGILGSRRR